MLPTWPKWAPGAPRLSKRHQNETQGCQNRDPRIPKKRFGVSKLWRKKNREREREREERKKEKARVRKREKRVSERNRVKAREIK